MFLTVIQVEELTGYRRYSRQRAVLDRNAVPYFTAASGRPVVLKEDLVQRTISHGSSANQRLRLAASNAAARK